MACLIWEGSFYRLQGKRAGKGRGWLLYLGRGLFPPAVAKSRLEPMQLRERGVQLTLCIHERTLGLR